MYFGIIFYPLFLYSPKTKICVIWKQRPAEVAKKWIEEHKDTSFFLNFALHQLHVPRTPNQRFVGKSGMGPRGDVILEAGGKVALRKGDWYFIPPHKGPEVYGSVNI